MKIKVSTIYEIDIEKERKRLNKCFKGKQLKRHLALLNLFEEGKFKDWLDVYEKLPYDNKEGCTEREFVGEEIYYFMFIDERFKLKLVSIEHEVLKD
ncbi:MAG: hypothetical protein M0R32_08250 [Candidatus Cloacimonetes bacterium]|jgi:hypothetical protein|nr:hypothetical protein [Candidatus Cloacimonadota bacterium]